MHLEGVILIKIKAYFLKEHQVVFQTVSLILNSKSKFRGRYFKTLLLSQILSYTALGFLFYLVCKELNLLLVSVRCVT